jgi:RHS repeat-associated protein
VYSYDYDAEGNRSKRTELATGKVDEYTWDYRNRLTSVVGKNVYGVVTQTVSYEYDVNDLRVKKIVDGSIAQGASRAIENYYLDGDNIAFVTDGVGDRTFHYLYGLEADQVLAQDSETGMVWSLADRLGSIDVLVDGSGAIVDQRTYDSFGNTLSQLDPNVKFRFGYTGRESDPETGLYYYRARYFDANVGRFISTDPIGFEAGDANLYRYVGNRSTLATDPSGEFVFLPLLVLAAGGFIAGAGISTIRQGLELAEGSRKEFSLGEVLVSGVIGSVLTPVLVFAPELGIPLAIKGFADGVKNMSNDRPLSGAFDIATSIIPFASGKVRSQSAGEGTLFGQFRGLGKSASKSDRKLRLTDIEAFDKFHGITAEYQVSTFKSADRRAGNYHQVIGELPQSALGHVGFSFNSGKKIYGFGPVVENMSASEAFSALRGRQQFDGVLTNDTAMFSMARKLGLGITEQKYNVGLLRYLTGRTQAKIQQKFGTPANTKYMLPPKPKGTPFPENCYNCATYPSEALGLPTSSPTGHLK